MLCFVAAQSSGISHVNYSKQIFKAGKLIYTTAATMKPDQQLEDLPFVKVSDGAIPFNEINLTLSGDILIRARHLTSDNRRMSMFRWVRSFQEQKRDERCLLFSFVLVNMFFGLVVSISL